MVVDLHITDASPPLAPEACVALYTNLATRRYAVVPLPRTAALFTRLALHSNQGPAAAVQPGRERYDLKSGECFEALDAAARVVLQALSAGARLPSEHSLFPLLEPYATSGEGCASELNVFRYAADASCPAHVDRGLLTLICSPARGDARLEVEGADGTWQAVDLQPGYVAVLAGHTLAYVTGGLFAPGKHRVVAAKAGQQPRETVVFRLRGRVSAVCDAAAVLGQPATLVPLSYRALVTVQELEAEFRRTHASVNVAAQTQTADADTSRGGKRLRTLLTSDDSISILLSWDVRGFLILREQVVSSTMKPQAIITNPS